MNSYLERLLQSEIDVDGKTIKVDDLKWEQHPVYEGVEMKHLVRGMDTDNHNSKSLVRISKGSVIKTHNHPNNSESIKFISGNGTLVLKNKIIKMSPRSSVDLEKGANHEIRTFDEDVYLIASFMPALY